MANPLETIQQILAPANAPYINGTYAQKQVSKAILENMFQGLVEKEGKGVSDKFVSEADANESAQIAVNRIIPVEMKPREHGALKNGGAFSDNAHYTQTETVQINVLTYVDDPIILPRVTQDRIKVDLLAQHVKIYSDKLSTIINGMTTASKLLATYSAPSADRNIVEISASDISNKLVLQRFIEANDKLDEGDLAHGIDAFPMDSRIAVFKVGYRSVLKGAGVLTLGGANYAYEIARKSGLNNDNSNMTLDNGFWGEIDGVEVHGISNASLLHADGFLGLPAGELKASSWLGYISSSVANARGVSTVEMVKIVDTRGGQGVEIQPLAKLGAVSWYQKGNAMFVKDSNYSPIDNLKAIFSGSLSSIAFALKGAGSRYFPVGTISAISTTAFTADATALDDFNTDHIVAGAYVVTTSDVTTLEAFNTAYNGVGAEKGLITTLGTSQNFGATQTAGDVLNCLFIADDGSIAIVSKAIA